jgi:CheY-like chemotaxis protein
MQKQKNVLIVDDYGENLLVLESILEDLPIIILKAFNGRDALNIILRKHIDMIILDIQMPEMNGFEVAKLIRTRKKTKHIPIIFLSGLIDEDYFDFIDTYPDYVEYFQKPLNIENIRKRVNYYLNELQIKV